MIGLGIFSAYKLKKNNTNKYPEYVKYITVNEEFFNSMTDKELLCYKIINSIDFYNNVSGTYKEINNTTGESLEIKYYADIEKNKSYSIMDDNNEVLNKDDKVILIDKNKNTYKEYKITNKKDNDISKLKVKDRVDDKNNFIHRRDGDFLDILRQILFSQSLYTGDLIYFDDWTIDEKTTYLGREAIKITGRFNCVGKTHEEKYNIIIDEATGIVLKKESFDGNNNVICSLETTEIHVDEGIPDDIFEIDMNKYKIEE